MLQEITIGRLQLHSGDNGQRVARGHITRQIEQARLQPDSLPGSAILVIRHLRHPLPLSSQAGRAQAWSRQLQQAVAQCARQAVRPYHQANGHLAQSVLFLDPVELLFCYTQDLLAQCHCWYWPELFALIPTQSMSEQLLLGWATYVGALPKTLIQLPPAVATQAVRQLERKALQTLIATFHQHFGVAPVPRPGAPAAQPARGVEPTAVTSSGVTPPWREWLPSQLVQNLPPLAIYLLGISHTLVTAPQLAQTASFMTQAAAWLGKQEILWAQERAHTTPAGLKAESTVAQNPPIMTIGSPTPDAERQMTGEQTAWAMGASKRSIDAQATSAPPVEPDHPLTAKAPPASQPDPTSLAPDQHSAQAEAATQPAAHEWQPSPAEVQAPWLPMGAVHTVLGGAFYLLNLITWLQRDSRLSLSEPLSEPTNLWVAVAVLMSELLGEQRRQHRADPLWGVLAALANQDGETLAALLHEELAGDRTDAERHDLVHAVHWWRQQYRTWIQDQLTQRLTDDLVALAALFCLPAALLITNTHIDVIMPLDAITVAIRRAGLDRSPGWLPDFGYIVTFVFR